jgi:hypothetical protein
MPNAPEVPVAETRAVFDGADVVAIESIAQPVPAATLGLWRVRTANDRAVLKLVGYTIGSNPKWQSGKDVDHWYYWKREALAYESGLLGSLPDGLRAPACRGVFERSDGTIAIWMEDVGAAPATHWALDRYEVAAHHFGGLYQFEPDADWLSHDWLRSYISLRRATIDQPWVALLLDALDRMPRAFCHFDLHPANLFGDDDGPTVAIDWSFVGIGAIGEDVGNLVPDAVLDFHIAPGLIDELYERLVRGYTAGLREAGWRGADSLPRAAMSMTIAAKYAWIAPELEHAVAEQREMLNRRPLNETLKWWEPAVVFIEERTREAHALLDAL